MSLSPNEKIVRLSIEEARARAIASIREDMAFDFKRLQGTYPGKQIKLIEAGEKDDFCMSLYGRLAVKKNDPKYANYETVEPR